ncbi:hypothetical protein M758_4G063000 [Ceratodon purpureus]|uniref:Uncharacterized protein n=1 Tax=Ceratodon purpureus TaxID=3225 RepID=A0A8T0I969_CERPU|nr:hypothetical protein KC19_4G065400 [Ceratodon purpureus]KAG0618423.1 hypothetical protein M758_4G063000 [Ceratodon purpureus]
MNQNLYSTMAFSTLATGAGLRSLGLGSPRRRLPGALGHLHGIGLLRLLLILGLLDPLLDLTQRRLPSSSTHLGLLRPLLLDHLQGSTNNGPGVGLVGGAAFLLDSSVVLVLLVLLPEQRRP